MSNKSKQETGVEVVIRVSDDSSSDSRSYSFSVNRYRNGVSSSRTEAAVDGPAVAEALAFGLAHVCQVLVDANPQITPEDYYRHMVAVSLLVYNGFQEVPEAEA